MKIQAEYFKILFINILIFIIIGELAMRIYSPIPNLNLTYGTAEVDSEIGWISKENYKANRQAKDMLGNTYPVQYHTEKDGFKAYGNPNSEKPKLLFLGDSFVQSVEVSNDKCFYNLIKDSLDVEVFAYGVAGYSQYQQYLILDRYFDEIRPDIIIWQSCTNDFTDNHFDLMVQCEYQMKKIRPYLSHEGKVIYKSPTGNNFSYKMRRMSALYYNLELLANFGAEEANLKRDGEHRMRHEGLDYPLFKESVDITNMILKKAFEKVNGRSKMVGFFTVDYDPLKSMMRKSMMDNGFIFIDEVHEYTNKAQFEKENINTSDGYHWNEKGHGIVAKAILDGFERRGILRK